MKEKKFIIINRITFILFTCYLLTYLILPIYTKDIKYLIFIIFPLIFLISLLINIAFKYDKINTNKMSSFSKIITILNILINGFTSIASSLVVGTINWKEKKKQIKKYPSITPLWLFLIMFSTVIANFCFGLILSTEGLKLNTLLIATIISLIFLFLAQITSSISLYYNNGKKEVQKMWKDTIIVIVSLILLFVISFAPILIDEYNKNKEKDELEERIDRINKINENIKNKENIEEINEEKKY